jgi:hypothetical protein
MRMGRTIEIGRAVKITNVIERVCTLTAESQFGTIPGWSHPERCSLYNRKTVLKAALLWNADKPTRLGLLSEAKVYLLPEMLDIDKRDPSKIQSSRFYEITGVRVTATRTLAYLAVPSGVRPGIR